VQLKRDSRDVLPACRLAERLRRVQERVYRDGHESAARIMPVVGGGEWALLRRLRRHPQNPEEGGLRWIPAL